MCVVSVSGKAQSGKSEFARIAVEEFGFQELSFARALKDECFQFLRAAGVDFKLDNLFGSNDDKETPLITTNKPILKELCGRIDEFFDSRAVFNNGVYWFTGRALLQWWGTEYRRSEDQGYWTNKVLDYINKNPGNYVISDLRFITEAVACFKSKHILVRIERPHKIIVNANHLSEIELDEWDRWDYKIINDSSLEEYRKKVRKVMTSTPSIRG